VRELGVQQPKRAISLSSSIHSSVPKRTSGSKSKKDNEQGNYNFFL